MDQSMDAGSIQSTAQAIIGRGYDADIQVSSYEISKTQCSFEINLQTRIVMLYDRPSANVAGVVDVMMQIL